MNPIYLCRTESFGSLLRDRVNKKSVFLSQPETSSIRLGEDVIIEGNKIRNDEVRFIDNDI